MYSGFASLTDVEWLLMVRVGGKEPWILFTIPILSQNIRYTRALHWISVLLPCSKCVLFLLLQNDSLDS